MDQTSLASLVSAVLFGLMGRTSAIYLYKKGHATCAYCSSEEQPEIPWYRYLGTYGILDKRCKVNQAVYHAKNESSAE